MDTWRILFLCKRTHKIIAYTGVFFFQMKIIFSRDIEL